MGSTRLTPSRVGKQTKFGFAEGQIWAVTQVSIECHHHIGDRVGCASTQFSSRIWVFYRFRATSLVQA
jgi:hypothetical protein